MNVDLPANERRAAGAIVSTDPLVTIGKHEDGLPMGLASLFPERFESKPSLHFLGLTWSGEGPEELARIVGELADARRRLPRARFVFNVNTHYESALFSRAGIPNIVANGMSFVDERIFQPPPGPLDSRQYDAAYTARLDPFKRHELAAAIPSVLLIYGSPAPGELEQVREALPQAYFANHEVEPGRYKHIHHTKMSELLNKCSVGLCLSAEEGAMRSAMEYLLCGLPVVSTDSVGGRDRYFIGPHARVVPPDADKVAAAVADLKAKAIPPHAIREYVGRLIAFDRHNFMTNANKIVERELGVRDHFRSFAPFAGFAVRWRLTSEIEAEFARP
jgi:glycosyltransferase involved in cell wall biosynthesis